MLSLRQEQLDALAEPGLWALHARLCRHARRCFPSIVATFEDPDLAEFVRRSMDRAMEYGLETERSIAKYLNMRVVLGPDFDTEYDWARAILHGDRICSARPKIDHLCAVALEVTKS